MGQARESVHYLSIRYDPAILRGVAKWSKNGQKNIWVNRWRRLYVKKWQNPKVLFWVSFFQKKIVEWAIRRHWCVPIILSQCQWE